MAHEKLQEVELALTRREAKEVALEGAPARAAVALLFEPRIDDLYLFFIHRAANDRDPWSGHMGFPGGFMDPEDADLLSTVSREVREELGFDLSSSARLLGRLDEIQGVARGRQLPLVISPFLFALERAVEPVPNQEVQGVLWVPMTFLENPRNESMIEHQIGEQRMRLPAFIYEDRTIWGLTFRMLQNLLDVIRSTRRPQPG
ncbi:MAG: NUDIX hydrolase [Candidatus Binatia bacterium]